MGYSVYIHVPFCRKARCPYCDFYSEVNLTDNIIERFGTRILQELECRSGQFAQYGEIESVFFGGGTPSVLPASTVERILGKLSACSPLAENAEITLECNPEDIDPEYCRGLLSSGVNRLSIGVQSLDDKYLKRLGRIHDAEKAAEAVGVALASGFRNISADLIFAGPGSSAESAEYSIRRLIELGVTHISAYGYHLEQGASAFGNRLYAGADDESYREQYLVICDLLSGAGWRHYEISNWTREHALASRHNLAYWTGKPYLGLGPSAHSYLPPDTRVSVRPSLKTYLETFETETEKLSAIEIVHERLMLALRLDSGLALNSELTEKYRELEIQFADYEKNGLILRKENGNRAFTDSGWLLYDSLITEIFRIIE